ncbi:hypothetical protein ACN20G_34540 (plasmid) [Streptomyces sp. BI20]|uniref:hypothetical protein n=1 Tax=Streptomyces sp. BI20 TaxID=3403460 RepID=UPI003C78B34F
MKSIMSLSGRTLAGALSAGLVLGVLGPLLTREAADGGRETVGGPVGHVVHLVTSAGWSWAALAFAVGWACRSWRRAAWAAPASLVVAVAAYYLVKLGQGDYRRFSPELPGPVDTSTWPIDWGNLLGHMVVWWIAALVFGPLLGAAGALARVPRPHTRLLLLAVPLTAVVDMSVRLPGNPELDGALTIDTWGVVRILAVLAAAAALALSARTALAGRRP